MSMERRHLAFAVAVFLAVPLARAAHEDWVEVRSPNFVVVSNAGEKRARKAALEFEQIRALFRQSIPVASAHPSPIITVMAVKDEASMHTLMPDYWTKGHVHPAGYFSFFLDQYYAAIQLDAQGANPYETLYHEYYHSLTMPFFPQLPLWVAEGLADFYGNTQISNKEAGLGYPDPILLGELKTGDFIPLETLFKVDQTSPYYNEENKTSMFYAQSWALVHYLMIGDRMAHKQMFVNYLQALSEGMSEDEAAAKAFGDLKKLQSALLSYIRGFSFYYMKTPAPTKISDSDFKVRQISEAEAEAYRGGFLANRGRTQEARPVLEQALREDPKLALAYQNLGIVDFREGLRSEAIASVSKAIDLDPKDGLARFLRAYLTFRSGGQIADNAQLEEDLRAAIAANPDSASAYSLLAVSLAAGEEKLDEALSMAQKAVSLEPGNAEYQLTLGQVLVRENKFEDAHMAGLRALAEARKPEEQARAREFLAYAKQAQDFRSRAESQEASATSGSTPIRETPSDNGGAATNSEGDSNSRPAVVAEGQVTSDICNFHGLQLEIKSDSGLIRLHQPENGQIEIEVREKPPSKFNLCNSMQGAKVRVDYVPDIPGSQSGAVQKIYILKMPD
jgi:tetratricopeptide (TPR) repeat protein